MDQQRAAQYFQEAAALCQREGGKLWGVSLCGPMVFADAASHTIATNQPAPDVKQPAALGFANAAMLWGDTRWSTFVWAFMPDDPHARGVLMLHELFHRVQPQLGLLLQDGSNEHLDTLDGRYWIQLEWRALAKALGSAGSARVAAFRDALTFRNARHKQFPGSEESERILEINEGLAQYTATVAAAESNGDAVADAVKQLSDVVRNNTLVRTFPYPLGAAYGLLLDEWSPGWTHRIKSSDNLALMAMAAAKTQPADDAPAAANRYGAAELRVAEEKRDAEQRARVAELRRRFVEGAVLITPGSNNTSFMTNGMTPIPGSGTVYPSLRATAEWGSLEASNALVAADRSKISVPAPETAAGSTISGDGWTLKLAPGWAVVKGARAGDYQVVRETPVR